METFAEVNGIRLHYLDHGGEGQPLILMPGLTANAHCFDGLVKAGLGKQFRVLALDLRGRGLSDKPDTGYSMEDHALDVLGLIDALNLENLILGGHSFGGLLSMYMAASYPDRMEKLVVMDAAGTMHPEVRDLIKPSVDRLGQIIPSWEEYLSAMKQLPFFHDWWDPTIESYYRADVEILASGGVKPRSKPEAIIEAVEKGLTENWAEHISKINHPLLLLNAPQGVGPGAAPVLPIEHALETVNAVPQGAYAEISGNHFTMLYSEGANEIVAAIDEFTSE